jgi:hypothetical protein
MNDLTHCGVPVVTKQGLSTEGGSLVKAMAFHKLVWIHSFLKDFNLFVMPLNLGYTSAMSTSETTNQKQLLEGFDLILLNSTSRTY